MRASKLLSLLVAILILAGTPGVAGVMAENQTAVEPGASPDNSTAGPPTNDTIITPVNNSTIQPPDNASVPSPVPDNNTAISPLLTLVLESHVYYPNDVVRAFVFNATDPIVTVIDPAGAVFYLAVNKINDSAFEAEFALDQSIILANYTVIATDNATGEAVNDTFEVTTRPVIATPIPNATMTPDNGTTVSQPYYLFLNLSQSDYTPPDKVDITVITNAGTPAVTIQDPVNNTAHVDLKNVQDDVYEGTYKLDKAVVLGNYTVLAYVNENGTYDYTTAYFNVTMGKSAEKGLRIQYAAYDPAQKAIVVRANISSASSDAMSDVKNAPAMKGMSVKGVKVLASNALGNGPKAQDKNVEVIIPVDNNNVDAVTRQFNVSRDIAKATTSVAVNAAGTNIHLSLNDKVDGCWYRMSTSIPAGYQVLKVMRADGTEIKNYVQVDRSTGEVVKSEVNWYVDNGTLYFYDDPINGYDITLLPPAAVNSLAVNVVYGGQLSAIIYPFNQSDSAATITANDHLGYEGDNGYANDIDADAGSKTAVRLYRNNGIGSGNLRMFGNDGTSYHTYSNANYQYVDLGTPVTIGFNTVPDGSVESVIISNYRTPMAGSVVSYVNITQKTIIRNNNLWFATVYYLNNAGGSDLNGVAFFQGADFNFNGQYQNDDDFYNLANDTVYGYMNNQNANSIHVGGFSSTIQSTDHDVAQYGTIWTRISQNNLQGGTSTNGIDGGMALEWDHTSTFVQGETWTIPVLWAVGQNTTGFGNTLNNALDHNVYDVGIKSIDTPVNGDSLDLQTTPAVTINATAMDLGVTDQSPMVVCQIKNSSGGIVYNTSTTVSLSIPYQETAPATFNWNLAGIPAGIYNISVYTLLSGDQNSSNNLKSITVYVRDFSLSPDQWVHANPGDNVLFPLNLSNLGSLRKFDLSLSPSTAGWASNLYLTNTSTLMASDTNGDGVWDWVNSSYLNSSSGLPSINITANGKAPLLLQKLVPAAADTGILDTITLTAYPGLPLANSSAILRTDTPLGAVANKTFYLHSLTLNTTPEAASTGSTAITSIFSMWGQVPAFADGFTISGNVSAPIYYTTTAAMPITATLFYTNGAGNSVQICTNTSTVPASASQTTPSMFNFTLVQAGGNVTVPRGSYLVLKIDNQQTTAFNVWYTSAYRSRIDVKTPTYVHVGAINTYSGANQTTNFYSGDTVYITANITDPIGSYDIWKANISINAPNGTYLVNNQGMTLNRTDAASPSLWKLYSYSFNPGTSLPPGVYGINVTAYESNGVIHRRNASFNIVANTPAIVIYPNSSKIGQPGDVVNIKHTVTNLNDQTSDLVNLQFTKTQSWNVSLYEADGITPMTDHNGDGIPDTNTLSPLGSKDVIVKVTIPGFGAPGDINAITVTAASTTNASVKSVAGDTVTVASSFVTKTLYLYPSPSPTLALNTSKYPGAEVTTTISASGNAIWSQTPAFARDYYLLGDANMTLYVGQASANHTIQVMLNSTNSTSSVILGSATYQLNATTGTPMMINFAVPVSSSNVTIPRGNWLSVKIINPNSSSITVYQSSQRDSRLDMYTSSYIHDDSMSISDQSNNPISTTTPPSTIKITTNVTDPFGSYDIRDVNVTIFYDNGTAAIGPQPMNLAATDGSSPSLWKRFERNTSLPGTLDSGNYTITVTANETNAVKDNRSTQLTIAYPVKVSASKSFSPVSGSDYTVTITVTNRDNHTVSGVHAYDFYASDFTVSGFSHPRISVAVNNAILQGNLNVFGPFQLSPNQVITITYTAHGVGDYRLSNMTIVGVDPLV